MSDANWIDAAGARRPAAATTSSASPSAAATSRSTASAARSSPPTTSARMAMRGCATASSRATRSSARCTRASSTCAPARRRRAGRGRAGDLAGAARRRSGRAAARVRRLRPPLKARAHARGRLRAGRVGIVRAPRRKRRCNPSSPACSTPISTSSRCGRRCCIGTRRRRRSTRSCAATSRRFRSPSSSPDLNRELDALCALHFSADELAYLRSLRFIRSDFVDFLRIFHFQRDFISARAGADGKASRSSPAARRCT